MTCGLQSQGGRSGPRWDVVSLGGSRGSALEGRAGQRGAGVRSPLRPEAQMLDTNMYYSPEDMCQIPEHPPLPKFFSVLVGQGGKVSFETGWQALCGVHLWHLPPLGLMCTCGTLPLHLVCTCGNSHPSTWCVPEAPLSLHLLCTCGSFTSLPGAHLQDFPPLHLLCICGTSTPLPGAHLQHLPPLCPLAQAGQ